MKYLVAIARYLTGALFIFSGLIKLNDPVGTQIKLEEYFQVFAKDFAPFFESLIPTALGLSVLLSSVEVALGIALIIGWRPKLTNGILAATIVFFTFLTFYSAYFNKVTDCGCFGDAIKLTPWQSFGKDVALCITTLILIIGVKYIKPIFDDNRGTLVALGSFAAAVFVAVYAIQHLPYIDFRPYKVGANIKEDMKLPPNAKPDVYAIFYTMKHSKTGEIKKLNDKEYISTNIWQDTLWQITETSEPTLVQAGDKAKIHDFVLRTNDIDPAKQDITQMILTGPRLLILFRNSAKADVNHMTDIKKLVAKVDEQRNNLNRNGADATVLYVTASDGVSFDQFRHEHQLTGGFAFLDATVMKTIMRTDPGVVLLRDGVVLGKWSYSDVPEAKDVFDLLQK